MVVGLNKYQIVKNKKKNIRKMRFIVPSTKIIIPKIKKQSKYKKRKNDYLGEI